MIDISIITVTWNSADYIADQIRSVVSVCAGVSFEHIVIDNASTDDTIEVVSSFDHVILLKNETNLGFGKANNIGFGRARGEKILLLNPDMKLVEGLFPLLRDSGDDVGIIGGKLLGEDGELNPNTTPRRFPTFRDQFFILTKLVKILPRLTDEYMMRGVDFSHEMDVDSVQGSCIFFDRSLVDKIGGLFDEKFFIWFEDVDLCRRVHEARLRVVYQPSFVAIDIGGSSFRKRGLLWKQWQFMRSMLKYFMKWNNI